VPGLDCFDTAKRIRARALPAHALVFLTGHAQNDFPVTFPQRAAATTQPAGLSEHHSEQPSNAEQEKRAR
jgi:hypothetical protein